MDIAIISFRIYFENVETGAHCFRRGRSHFSLVFPRRYGNDNVENIRKKI